VGSASESAERLIGSIRRECLDHVVVFGEQHLRHLLNSYKQYYNEVRTHVSLKKDAPTLRETKRAGRALAQPILGGLRHRHRPSLNFRQGQNPNALLIFANHCSLCPQLFREGR
jgi:hypothetical protein